MLMRSLHTLRRALPAPQQQQQPFSPFQLMRASSGIRRRFGSRAALTSGQHRQRPPPSPNVLVRGPSAGPGTGRSAWVAHHGVVYTVAYPFGATAEDGVGDQTRKALASLDERLEQAGTVGVRHRPKAAACPPDHPMYTRAER